MTTQAVVERALSLIPDRDRAALHGLLLQGYEVRINTGNVVALVRSDTPNRARVWRARSGAGWIVPNSPYPARSERLSDIAPMLLAAD